MASRSTVKALLMDWVLPLGLVSLVLLFGGPLRYSLPTSLNGVRETVYATLATICGSLLGFIIAGVTILLTVTETERIKLMNESGMYSQVIRVFYSAAKWLACAMLINIIGLAVDRNGDAVWWYSWLSAAVTTGCLVRLWKCLWVLESVTDLVLRDKREKQREALPTFSRTDDPRRSLD